MSRLEIEFLRKTVHLSGVFLLPVLLWNRHLFAGTIAAALLIYLFVEWSARMGKRIPLLTRLTEACKRSDEKGRPSLGPILLAAACIVTPCLFGAKAAAAGLAQAFVADTAATLVGMQWGRVKLPWSSKKSRIGSLAYFLTAVLTDLCFVPFPKAFLLALAGTAIESLPIREGDNLTVPMGVGWIATVI